MNPSAALDSIDFDQPQAFQTDASTSAELLGPDAQADKQPMDTSGGADAHQPTDDAPGGKKQKSCAPCRIRRVKCDRKPGQIDCIKCVEKGLHCSAMPDRKRVSRTGKRIEQARGAFGSAHESVLPPAQQIEEMEIISSSPWLESERSLGARLGTTEIQGAVTASLLEQYMSNQGGVGKLLVTDTSFVRTFELANRRVSELNPAGQVLCSVIMAVASRCTDHPALIGAGAPRTAELGAAARAGIDLRPFGRRREEASRALFTRALELADRCGTLRDPSVESMAALVLIEGLIEGSDNLHSEARPYTNAYTGHGKILLERASTYATGMSPVSGTVLGWTAYIRDAFTAANQGRAPSFSEDDKYLLIASDDRLPRSLVKVLAESDPALQAPDDAKEEFWKLFSSIMHTSADAAREITTHLTGPRACLDERIDENFANELLQTCQLTLGALDELERRAELFRSLFPEIFAAADLDTIVRSISASVCSLSMLLNRIVGQRLAGRYPGSITSKSHHLGASAYHDHKGDPINPWPALPGPTHDEPYWTRLFALRRLTYAQAFRAARKITAIVGRTVDGGTALSEAWIDPRNVQVIFSKLPMWSAPMVNMPTVEQGGPHADYTFSAKLQDLEWLKKGCYSAGWMSASLVNAVEWVKAEIAKTEAAQSNQWLNRSTAPPTSESSTLAPTAIYNSALNPNPIFPVDAVDTSLAFTPVQAFLDRGMWPQNETLEPSSSASPPTSPPSATVTASAGSPSSGGSSGASPTSSGASSGQQAFSDEEVRSLLGQVSTAQVPNVAAPLLGANSALPADLWQTLAQGLGAEGDALSSMAAGAAATGAAPSPKGLPTELMGDVDWNDLLGVGSFGGGSFDGAWTMLGGQTPTGALPSPMTAAFSGDPIFSHQL